MTSAPAPRSLAELRMDDAFTEALPADPKTGPGQRQVRKAAYAYVEPKGFAAPRTLAVSPEVLELLALDPAAARDPEFAQVFSGSKLLEGSRPYAMAYGGHQFGHWAGQLGDGRALALGQVRGADGRRWMLQLKGAGPTPFSRMGDGLAVLRSSLREFLCSEAMAHLGVPTTRALSLVLTGDQVERDMFYDGNPELEPGAVVCRVSRSFTRFGHFELCASRGDQELLTELLRYSMAEEWELAGVPPKGEPLPPDLVLAWFDRVSRSNRELVVHWMRVGFVHGVLNTDNLSVLGETIDYGPYGWLEDFDLSWTPNTTDAQGRRYAFGAQAGIVHWNLTRLASALVPLVGETEPLQQAMNAWPQEYEAAWRAMQLEKLGLLAPEDSGDGALIDDLYGLLERAESDFTLAFRGLARLPLAERAPTEPDLRAFLEPVLYRPGQLDAGLLKAWATWAGRYAARAARDRATDAERAAAMDAVNPLYVPRNFQAQLAIDAAAKGDAEPLLRLLDVLRRPYTQQPGAEAFAARRPEWARHRPGCSQLSCSS